MLQAALSPRNRVQDAATVCACLRELIVKLRWMGMDTEADKLCRKLEAMSPSECAPYGPQDTD